MRSTISKNSIDYYVEKVFIELNYKIDQLSNTINSQEVTIDNLSNKNDELIVTVKDKIEQIRLLVKNKRKLEKENAAYQQQVDRQSIKISDLEAKLDNNYVLPKFDKHKRCNCAVCRYVHALEDLLSETEYQKYKDRIAIIEGDYELANIEELEELSMENCSLKEQIMKKEKVRYLNRGEVEQIFEFIWHNYNKSFKNELITAICFLAIPKIDLDPPCMPLNKTYSIAAKITKIEKGKPSVCGEILNNKSDKEE